MWFSPLQHSLRPGAINIIFTISPLKMAVSTAESVKYDGYILQIWVIHICDAESDHLIIALTKSVGKCIIGESDLLTSAG